MNSYSSPLPLTFGGYFLLAVGFLLIGGSLPLIRRSIRVNQYYGVRTDEAFKSEENWYAINHYGGKQFLGVGIFTMAWSILNIIFVAIGFVTHDLVAALSSTIPVVIALGIAFVRINAYNESFYSKR